MIKSCKPSLDYNNYYYVYDCFKNDRRLQIGIACSHIADFQQYLVCFVDIAQPYRSYNRDKLMVYTILIFRLLIVEVCRVSSIIIIIVQ